MGRSKSPNFRSVAASLSSAAHPVGSPRPDAPSATLPLRFSVLAGVVTVAAFLPALSGGFVNFDDDRVVVHNPYLHGAFANAWSWMWTTTFIGHYQPLTWVTLLIDGRVGGFRPFAFHLTTLALHALAAGLLASTAALLLRLAPSTRHAASSTIWTASTVAALFWAIHPLRVESVAWVSERRDPLSAVFLLLALHAYLRSVSTSTAIPAVIAGDAHIRSGRATSPKRTRDRQMPAAAVDGESTPAAVQRSARRWYVWSCVALTLSLLAKAWGMSFVVVVIVVDWAVLRRHEWRDKWAYAALGLISAVVAWSAQHNAQETMVPLARWGWTARILQACYGLCFYVWKTIVPSRLAVVYELPRDWHDLATRFVVAAVIVAAGTVAIAVRARRNPGVAGAFVAYAAILAPVLGFAQSGPQLVADRYAYVSSMALTMLIGAALVVSALRIGVRQVTAAAVTVLIACGTLTWNQTKVWHDSISLWTHAIESGHASYLARFNLGQALRTNGDVDGAIAQYRLALDRRPDSGNAWYVYANALKAMNDTAGAEAAYKRAIATADPATAEWMLAHVNLGNLYFSAGQPAAAASEYRAAVSQFGGKPAAEIPPEPYLYLGIALADSGDLAGARQALEVAERYPTTRARAAQELRRVSPRSTPR
jgi:protein O-mannosyl-transferase